MATRSVKMEVDMEGLLYYWEQTNQKENVRIYKELVSGTITIEEANRQMGCDYYEIRSA